MTCGLPAIFLVDDDDSVTTSLSWMLESVKLAPIVFNDPRQFLDEFLRFEGPACIVLDMRMAGMGGVEVLERVLEHRKDVPVTLLSAHGDVPIAVRSMKLGAFDFLQKPCDPQTFLDTVNLMIRQAEELYEVSQEEKKKDDTLSKLSPREVEVFNFIIQGMSSKEIAYELNISPKTIDIHRANILKKVDVANYRDLIQKFT